MAPPNNRFYAGGEQELRGFDVRGATPYGYVPTRVNFQLTNPDGSCVPRDPTNPEDNQCIQVPLPVYGIASIGGDTRPDHQREYRIPVVGPFTFSFFDDFGIDAAIEPRPVEAEPRRICLADRAALRLPGVQQRLLPGRHPRLRRSDSGKNIRPVAGTNFVPRMSTGAELSVLMPIINAPFRLYYAYNPLRLYERPYCNDVILGQKQQSCSAELITRAMFPPGGAGDYTYQEAIQSYGAQYVFREPRKTFRLTISTTF